MSRTAWVAMALTWAIVEGLIFFLALGTGDFHVGN